MTSNDISGISQVHIVQPDIEMTHFEDTYERNRLNKEIDINNIDIHRLIAAAEIKENGYQPITQATIRRISTPTLQIRMHLDSGANRSITPHRGLLHNISTCSPIIMDGVGGDIKATEYGYLKLTCQDGTYIWAKTYFCNNAPETIVSPTDITLSTQNHFTAWEQYSDTVTGNGRITFYTRSGLGQAEMSLVMINGLWYSTQTIDDLHDWTNQIVKPIIRNITQRAEYELWHQRLCHAGQKALSNIHKCADGIPDLNPAKHPFHKCEACMKGKVTAAPKHKHTTISTTQRGQLFHMDFGFVRGSAFKQQNEKGKIITSRDGYNSYLIIVDAHTRYTWIFLSASKEPPLQIVSQFLQQYGIKEGTFRQVRCDQGGELARSAKFRTVIQQEGYSIDPTGSDNSSKNGVAERPNRTYGEMMRAMLMGAGLDSKYWSYALIQAVFVRNRLPHSHHKFQKTPFEALTGRKPNLKHLKIFGSRVIAKKPGQRRARLDDHTSSGIFLHHTSSTSISKYLDENTNREKIASHLEYDEAHYTTQHKPMGAKHLIDVGIKENKNIDPAHVISNPQEAQELSSSTTDNTQLIVKKLSDKAVIPTKATTGSTGFDLYNAAPITIEPGAIQLVPTDLSITCPPGTYGRIAPRSSITVKQQLDIRAGVIDSDYTGHVLIAMHNIGTETRQISQGNKVAQLILEQISPATIQEVQQLTATDRGDKGFGSSDNPSDTPSIPIPNTVPNVIPCNPNEINPPQIHRMQYNDNAVDKIPQLYLSCDPFGPTLTMPCRVTGVHPLLGLQLDDTNMNGRFILRHCEKGTPSAKIRKWRSTLRNSNLVRINDIPVSSKQDVQNMIEKARQSQRPELELTFATEEKVSMHPEHGTPQLFFDQLNTIAAYLQEMKYNETFMDLEYDEPTINYLQKKRKNNAQFTRNELKKRDDWDDWKRSEFKQLDLYEIQDTFGPPTKRPAKANILNLLWAYSIKADLTKKSRCVCNGNPRRKGTVTLAHTFAACLEQPGARTFGAATPMLNMIVLGADASNAFAEAPPPKAPLYVEVDQQFREWWVSKGRKEIPKGYVLPVRHALQGHPESPRLWATMIDDILRTKVNLQPCTHEPCLYSGFIDGEKVLFLRQVDDFAVACINPDISNKVIDMISNELSAPMKKLGVVERYNGLDITQTEDYVKIHTSTYLTKTLQQHDWLTDTFKPTVNPIPMREDAAYQKILDHATGPDHESDREKLEQEMNFIYRQALGETLFAMITCRPDISYAVIKLAQFANNPAKEHYIALKNIFRYLRQTLTEGIIYWRKGTTTHKSLQPSDVPKIFHQQNNNPPNKNPNLAGSVDSDWASNTKNRKSVSGMVMFLAGGAIHYKTKLQNIVSHSSTEAEFIAACDAAKMAIYLRTILEDIGLPQEEATMLYEDNTGALMMANARQPTRRTRHMEIKHFAIQDWVERDMIVLEYIMSPENSADHFTKPLARTAFYKHSDVIMGRIPPEYYKGILPTTYDNSTETLRRICVQIDESLMLPTQHGGVLYRVVCTH